ncbi:MAG: hypothetical protein ACJA1A_002121 [Saprospiraceae bacterium]|jgi:hypothetical protein
MKTLIKSQNAFILLTFSILALLYVAPLQAQVTKRDHRTKEKTNTQEYRNNESNVSNTAKISYKSLNHYWSNTRTDNLITATTGDEKAALGAKYRFVRLDGYVMEKASNIEGEAVPLYLFYSNTRKDNFTTATAEGIRAAKTGGYRTVRIEGYVLKTVKPEYQHLYKPLWLYYHDTRKDNFTIATSQGMRTAESGGYRKVRIEGYVSITNRNRAPEIDVAIDDSYSDIPVNTTRCSEQKLQEILAPATASSSYVKIDCNLTLNRNDIVTKRLVFEGSAASGVTCDCNGATLDGGKNKVNYRKDMIEVKSKKTTAQTWIRPQYITINYCNIIGSVRIWGMGKNGEWEDVKESSKREPTESKHVLRVRNNAPRNIVFDGITITGVGRNPLYFAPGVTYSKLINSEMKGKSDKVGIYLDAESAYNTFENNYIHVNTEKDGYGALPAVTDRGWPQVAIDGSSWNNFVNNRFSSINNGGIYFYRNCGEGGTIRHTPPERNIIKNNSFYYNKYKGGKPAIYLGSRDYGFKERTFGHCDSDDGRPYGSSSSDKDYARYNTIQQNQFYNRKIYKHNGLQLTLVDATLNDMIKTKGESSNSPNYISNNEMID